MLLRVGTDCSGIEAPIQALKKLKIPFSHEFSSDIDKHVIKSIQANYSPKVIFGDITQRKLKDVPDIDLYVCGFPCQTFSSAGKRAGLEDKRGTIIFHCLKLIKNKQPKYFILENVKGLLTHENGETFNIIWNEIKNLSVYGYRTSMVVLNTKDYGIPQNRERIFFIGTKGRKFFKTPEEKPLQKLERFVDWKDTSKDEIRESSKPYLNKINKQIFIDLNFLKYNNFSNSHIVSPCLNTQAGLWNHRLHRFANVKEYLMLQGFPANFIQVVTDSQMKKQIGNSMSVNVVEAILNVLI